MDEKKYVVTIARQFGSLGRPIAMRMSEKLGVEFYDRDIVEEAAKKLNLPVSKINEIEESAKKNLSRLTTYPGQDCAPPKCAPFAAKNRPFAAP